MLSPPDDRTAAALSRLGADADFNLVCAWLDENLASVRDRLMSEQSESALRRLQGCAITIHDLLSQIDL